jgi:lipid-A-disaccharide synthase
MRILISAGEASGEMYGAGLLEALRGMAKARPELGETECFGLGGERMRAAGCETVVDAKDVAVVGIFEVLSHLPTIYSRFHKLVREAERRKPDVAVLIDFPDFNFRLAKELHKRGIPVVYYVSPQLWAWRPKRIELVKKYVRKMLVIFPFEEPWYRERGVEAEFVGHPLGELKLQVPSPTAPPYPLESPDKDRAQATKPQIALLPGSRKKEIGFNLPVLLDVAAKLGHEFSFVLPLASTVDDTFLYEIVRKQWGVGDSPAEIIITRDARAALASSRAAVVASGTATVEASVIGTPFVMVYRVAPSTYALGKRMVKVPFYAMPNLIAGREVVPELVQENFTAERVSAELNKIIPDGPDRERMLEGLNDVRRRLRGAETVSKRAFERAAEAVVRAVGSQVSRPLASNNAAKQG